MARDGHKSLKVKSSAHKRLGYYGMMHETYSQALERLLDEAGVPPIEEVPGGIERRHGTPEEGDG